MTGQEIILSGNRNEQTHFWSIILLEQLIINGCLWIPSYVCWVSLSMLVRAYSNVHRVEGPGVIRDIGFHYKPVYVDRRRI